VISVNHRSGKSCPTLLARMLSNPVTAWTVYRSLQIKLLAHRIRLPGNPDSFHFACQQIGYSQGPLARQMKSRSCAGISAAGEDITSSKEAIWLD
jgi:hypothetical protein